MCKYIGLKKQGNSMTIKYRNPVQALDMVWDRAVNKEDKNIT